MDMPGPVSHLVAYREGASAAGFALKFIGGQGREALQALLEDQSDFEQEIGNSVRFEVSGKNGDADQVVGVLLIEHNSIHESDRSEDAELAWLCRSADNLVNALRPRLAGHLAD